LADVSGAGPGTAALGNGDLVGLKWLYNEKAGRSEEEVDLATGGNVRMVDKSVI
jgi:hypothetical protein